MRILVVEDEESLAEALVEALEYEAYAVDLAVTGSEADEMAHVNDYDLVESTDSMGVGTGHPVRGFTRRWRASRCRRCGW